MLGSMAVPPLVVSVVADWRRGARRASRMYRSGRMENVEAEGKGGMSGWVGVGWGGGEEGGKGCADGMVVGSSGSYRDMEVEARRMQRALCL